MIRESSATKHTKAAKGYVILAILAAQHVFLPGLCLAGEELLKNPDFERGIENGKATGWSYDGKKAQAGYGFGRNYSHGLKYVGDGGAYEWTYQRVPVEIGRNYRFEGWVKTDGIAGKKGVFLAVSCFTAEGKWKETSTSPNVTGTSDGWKQLSVDMTPPPKSAYAEISIRVSDGETGTFFADDFSFATVELPPIKFLTCDAYRSTATGGKVTFKLVSNLTDGEIAAKGWKGVVRLPNSASTSYFKVTPAPTFTNGVSTFAVDLDKMPFGKFPVSFAFVDGKGRVVVAETVFFNHVRTMPDWRVRIDSAGRTVLDGKLFFPFGMFMDSFAGDKAEKYAKGPFNCLLPYATLTRAQMDFAQAHGLKVVYSLKNLYRGYMFQPFPMADEADETAFVAAKVASLKDHPALLGWYTFDEIGPRMAPQLRERGRLVRMVDPDHPTLGCFNRPDAALEYMDTCDVLGDDPYPISAYAKTPISSVAAETRKVYDAYFGMRPVWQVTQAFDSSYIYKDKTRMRHPTGEEMLNMCLQCVAEGANGVLLWAYHHLGQNAMGHLPENFDKYWGEACKAGEEFRKMIPVFLVDDASYLVEGRKGDLPVRAWRYGGNVWVLAVNATYEPVKASIKVGGKAMELELPPLGHVLKPVQDADRGESVPVRQGGVDGRPFWNGHSARFLFAPAFEFKEVKGAVKYRFTVVDDAQQVRSFEAERPTAPLSPVWNDLPVGYVRVTAEGVDANGRVIGKSGTRRFWRDAPYAPGSYKGKPWSYMECVRRYYPVLFAHTNTQHFLSKGTPDGITDLFNIYPSKMNSALIRGMVRYSKLDPARREDALKVAKAAGDYMISISQPAGAPLAFFPPTYWKMEGQKTNFASVRYAGQNMLVYPARMGTAYLDLYAACGETRFRDAAIGIAQTYRKHQLPDGTWYLKMWERDGTPVIGGNGKRPVRLIPIQVCEFMEALADATGDGQWRKVAAKAFAYIENGPLKTWDWAAQFEDTPPSAGYRNHSSCEAMAVARYLMTRHSKDAAKMKLARDLVRWVEDQFVFWRKPCQADGKCAIVGMDDEFGPWKPNKTGYLDFDEWPEGVPGVTEKYRWTMMENALTASMARLYLLLYRIDGDRLALAKARTLCDSIVRIQEMGGDGEIASEWRKPNITGSRCPHIWINCSVATVSILEDIAAELECEEKEGRL